MKVDWESVVKIWLIEEDLFEREMAEEEIGGAPVEFAYSFVTGDVGGHRFHHVVLQPKGQDKLLLLSPIQVAKEHQDILRQKSRADRHDFLWKIRFDLLWKQTGFRLQEEEGVLQHVEFTRELQGDGTHKGTFQDAVTELHRVKLYVTWCLEREKQLAGLRA